MATCCDVAGAEYPKTLKGRNIQPLEGRSLRPVLEGMQREPHELLFWEHIGNKAIRQGKWKLVSEANGRWELYDLEADRTELTDLAAKYPEKAAELAGLWERWAKRCGVRI
jgi:arylsulfatase